MTPEELTLLKPTHTWTTSPHSKGELSIDAKMLRQLSEAGMTIGRQIETSAVDIVLQSTKDAQTVRKFAEKYAINDKEQTQILENLFVKIKTMVNVILQKTENGIVSPQANLSHEQNGHNSSNNGFNGNTLNHNDTDLKTHLIDILSSTIMDCVLSAKNTCVSKIKQHHNLSIYEIISQALAEKLCFYFDEAATADRCNTINVNVIEKMLASPVALQQLEQTVNHLVEQTIKISKVDLIKSTISKQIYNDSEILNNICIVLQDENEDDMIEAVRELFECDPKILYRIVANVKNDVDKLTDDVCTVELLKKCVITAVKQSANNEIVSMSGSQCNETLNKYLMETIALAKALGLTDVAQNLINLIHSNVEIVRKLEQDENVMDLIERVVVMYKLSKNNPDRIKALQMLKSDPYGARKDPKIRELLRRSGICTIRPIDKSKLTDSNEVPISLFCSDNQLAMEDFLMRRQTKSRGAFLIVKEGLQAVVPRELSRDVLTGKCAYTVLDENGIRHFEPLHVFSALKLNFPSSSHRFSMYSCDVMNGDNNENVPITKTMSSADLMNGLSLISDNRIKTKLATEHTDFFNKRRLRSLCASGRQVNKRHSYYY